MLSIIFIFCMCSNMCGVHCTSITQNSVPMFHSTEQSYCPELDSILNDLYETTHGQENTFCISTTDAMNSKYRAQWHMLRANYESIQDVIDFSLTNGKFDETLKIFETELYNDNIVSTKIYMLRKHPETYREAKVILSSIQIVMPFIKVLINEMHTREKIHDEKLISALNNTRGPYSISNYLRYTRYILKTLKVQPFWALAVPDSGMEVAEDVQQCLQAIVSKMSQKLLFIKDQIDYVSAKYKVRNRGKQLKIHTGWYLYNRIVRLTNSIEKFYLLRHLMKLTINKEKYQWKGLTDLLSYLYFVYDQKNSLNDITRLKLFYDTFYQSLSIDAEVVIDDTFVYLSNILHDPNDVCSIIKLICSLELTISPVYASKDYSLYIYLRHQDGPLFDLLKEIIGRNLKTINKLYGLNQ